MTVCAHGIKLIVRATTDSIQIAGSLCRICGGSIVTAREGIWCVACGSYFHVGCLERSSGACSMCEGQATRPQETALLEAQNYRPQNGPPPGRLNPLALIELIFGAVLMGGPMFLAARIQGYGVFLSLVAALFFFIFGFLLVIDAGRNLRKPTYR